MPPRFRPQLEALEDRCVPSTLTVTNNLDSGPGSLRAEIAAAKSGDTIVFAPGVSSIQLTSGELVINKNLTIQGPGAGQLSIYGGPNNPLAGAGNSRVFEVDGASTTVTLSGLSILDGAGVYAAGSFHAGDGQGGGILNYGTLTLSGCTLSDNTANSFNSGTTAYLGGSIYNAGTLTVSSCTLNNNSVGNLNGGIYSSGDGGGIYNAGTLTVSGSTLSSNAAYDSGGLVHGSGGGIYNAGSLTVSSSTLSGNTASEDGGGIYSGYKATATITASVLDQKNTAWDGGGIWNDGRMTLNGCHVYSNDASDAGGGIFNAAYGHLTIQQSSNVSGNYAASWYTSSDLYNMGQVKISSDSYVGLIHNQ
jgi:predicted outer membrane repeat protein